MGFLNGNVLRRPHLSLRRSGIPVGRHHRHVVDVFRGRRADGAVSVRGRRRARARPDQQLCVGDIPGMGAQRRQRRPAAVGLEGAVPPVRALDAVRDGPDQRGYPRLRAVPVSGHRQYHPRRAAGRGRGRGGLRMLFSRGGVQRQDGRHRHGGRKRWGVDIGSMSFISTWLSSSRPLWSWISKRSSWAGCCCTWRR